MARRPGSGARTQSAARAPSDDDPRQRILVAEADTIEALRDVFRAMARSAAADATMAENLVEAQKAAGYAVMAILGQGPLPRGSAPAFLLELVKALGIEAASGLVGKALDWFTGQHGAAAEKDTARAEQTKQAAVKEAVARAENITNVSIGTGTQSAPASGPPAKQEPSVTATPSSSSGP